MNGRFEPLGCNRVVNGGCEVQKGCKVVNRGFKRALLGHSEVVNGL